MYFNLTQTKSFDLKDGDLFHLKGIPDTHKVILITSKYVHAINILSERFIRLSNDITCAPVMVNLIPVDFNNKPFNADGLESSFMLSTT